MNNLHKLYFWLNYFFSINYSSSTTFFTHSDHPHVWAIANSLTKLFNAISYQTILYTQIRAHIHAWIYFAICVVVAVAVAQIFQADITEWIVYQMEEEEEKVADEAELIM